AGTPECTTTTTDTGKNPTVTVTFQCPQENSGPFHGTVTVSFPVTTPIAHYAADGVHLVFDTPLVLHFGADYIWTANNAANSNGELILEVYDTGEVADGTPCSYDSGTVHVAGGSTTDFSRSYDCNKTDDSNAVTTVPFSPVPFVIITSDSTFYAQSGGSG